ncbi:MAG: carboxymuconolactone decarboxylase family protein [Actinomycetota bacterium]|nr:carboxymuconolactone decarboxylase family protein [Actinomycetota bacterium]
MTDPPVSVANRPVALLGAADAPLLAQPFFANGDPGPLVAVLAHVPEMAEVALPFIGTVLGPSAIDARTKEIVILRTSARASCRYCVESHTLVALDSGLSADEVHALRGEADIDGAFPAEEDRSIIAWCDALATTGSIDPTCRDRLRRDRPDHVVVELTLLATTTLLLNRFCTALELPTSPDVLARLHLVGMVS